jgi:hydroxymethylglutaryl-CoA lyase
MANVFAALRVGVSSVESSFAGLGGCPFTKSTAGNVPTEDVVHALQATGRRSDVDLTKLVALAREVAGFFGRDLPGCVYKTGPIPAFQEVPA